MSHLRHHDALGPGPRRLPRLRWLAPLRWRSRRARDERYQHVLRLAGMSRGVLDVDTGELTLPAGWNSGAGAVAAPPASFDEFLSLVHPADRGGFREAHERAIANGASFALEYRLRPTAGESRWRRVIADVVKDRTGRVTHVVGVDQDISKRKDAEEQLRRTEEHYRTLVEQLPLASYVEGLGAESANYVSPQIYDLVGYTSQEWISDPTFFGKTLHPDDRDRVLSGFGLMHSAGSAFDCEYRLIARDGREVWVHDAAVIVRDDAGVPRYAQGYMIDITDRKHADAALQESRRELQLQALHDALTGLPNRTLFRDRAEQTRLHATRDGTHFGLMMIDLDRFKEVNDTLGHQSGDLLLCEVAERLQRAIRRSDTVARLGGDEFAVLAPGIGDPAAALALADKLRNELAHPVVIEGLTFVVEASIGVALFPDDGADVDMLTRHADVAMYVSKGAHAPVLYAEKYDRDSLARLKLVSELRLALERGELAVHYQPQADVSSGEAHSVEALVRWNHPERGLLAPEEFIPLAEQTGLIRSLTRYVLDTALGQCSAWQAEGRRVDVAVNITERELIDEHFPDEVATLLEKWGVEPGLLELEITETTIMSDPPRARGVLEQLERLGVRIAVDDFGNGESSFSYLRRLPISVLKIDRSYILSMLDSAADEALVRSAIELAHNLGLDVVAEGVETEEVKVMLEKLGCDRLQGFHLGRPEIASSLRTVGLHGRHRPSVA